MHIVALPPENGGGRAQYVLQAWILAVRLYPMALRPVSHTREQFRSENHCILSRVRQLTVGANLPYSFRYIGAGTNGCRDPPTSVVSGTVGRSIFIEPRDRDDAKKWKDPGVCAAGLALLSGGSMAIAQQSSSPANSTRHSAEGRDADDDRHGIRPARSGG
jgi:hypothetical protein